MPEVTCIVVLPAIPASIAAVPAGVEVRERQTQAAAENLVEGVAMEVLNIDGYGGNYNCWGIDWWGS